MLNRRILRTKVFKTIFCFAENPSMSLKEAEGLLELSCESTRDLYLYLLSIIPPLTNAAMERIEAAQAKFNPTEEELHPNLKFVENRIAPLLANDPDFNKIISRKKFSWENDDMLLWHLYESIKNKSYFKKYLASPESSLEQDAKLWAKIFEQEFEDNADLLSIIEDRSILWNDDLGYALTWCCRTMTSLGKGESWNLLPLYQSDMALREGMENDRSFVFTVLRTAYMNYDAFCEKVAALTPKWNRDRLCTSDLVLIACGLAESRAYPAVPSRIIINEYVELSKYYSTPDSSAFVNGLLDKLINNKQDNV